MVGRRVGAIIRYVQVDDDSVILSNCLTLQREFSVFFSDFPLRRCIFCFAHCPASTVIRLPSSSKLFPWSRRRRRHRNPSLSPLHCRVPVTETSFSTLRRTLPDGTASTSSSRSPGTPPRSSSPPPPSAPTSPYTAVSRASSPVSAWAGRRFGSESSSRTWTPSGPLTSAPGRTPLSRSSPTEAKGSTISSSSSCGWRNRGWSTRACFLSCRRSARGRSLLDTSAASPWKLGIWGGSGWTRRAWSHRSRSPYPGGTRTRRKTRGWISWGRRSWWRGCRSFRIWPTVWWRWPTFGKGKGDSQGHYWCPAPASYRPSSVLTRTGFPARNREDGFSRRILLDSISKVVLKSFR